MKASAEDMGHKVDDGARTKHLGEAPKGAVVGEAKMEDAKKLIEDGVPVLPLAFKPNRSTN